jgi:hypothetical protein
VVQPILVSELVMLMFILWLWYSVELRVRDIVAALATALGLGFFLFVSSPSNGTKTPSNSLWFGVGVVIVVAVVLCVLLARRGAAWWRALVLGAGASIGFALLSAITKSMTNLLVTGWGALFSSWQLYAIAVIGLGSFLIMQSAFQIGPFAASQSSLILVNPFVAIAIGHVLFDESLRGGPLYVSLEVVSLGVMVLGAVGLSTSSLVANVHAEKPGNDLLAGRGRYAKWRRTRTSP